MSDRLFRDRLDDDADRSSLTRNSRSPRPSSSQDRMSSVTSHAIGHSSQHSRDNSGTQQGMKKRPGLAVQSELVPWPTPPTLGDVQSAPGVLPLPPLRPVNRNSSQDRSGSLTGLTSGNLSSRENGLKMRIQALEDTIAEYERQKFNVMGTFAEYRERVAERERKLEEEYSSKIIALSEDVLQAKKAFEERMKEFACIQIQEKFEREKEAALDKLRQEHQKEIRSLEERSNQAKLLQLEQRYVLEIQRLEEERKSLRNEKERLGDTFESKFARAQSLYETEISAAKNLYSKELEALKDHEDSLKEELAARQEDYRDRLEQLKQQCAQSKDELQRCKDEVALLEARLRQKELQVKSISKELSSARTECEKAMTELESSKKNLEENKKHYEEKTAELNRKCEMLTMLESAKSKLEAVILDLQNELRSLKSKVIFLENERQNLESQSDSQAQLSISQVQALEAVLDTVTKEKQATKDHYERQLEQERSQAQEREFALRRELNRQIDELENQYNDLKDEFDIRVETEKEQALQKVRREYELKNSEAASKTDDLEAEVELLKKQLETAKRNLEWEREQRLNASVTDSDAGTPAMNRNESKERKDSVYSDKSGSPQGEHVKQLRLELESKEQALKTSNQQAEEMISNVGNMRRQLDEAQKELQQRDDKILQLQNEIEKLKNQEEIASKKDDFELEMSPEASSRKSSAAQPTKVAETQDQQEAIESKLNAESQNLREQMAQMHEDSEKTIDDLKSQLEKAVKELDVSKQDEQSLREQIERELRSKFSERAAESHVADMEAFERQLQIQKEEADANLKKQVESIKQLEEQLGQKDSAMGKLNEKVDHLNNELSAQRQMMTKKQQELRAFGAKTDEYIRKREQQQQLANERRMMKMREDFEKKLTYLINKRDELRTQLRLLRQQHGHSSGTESDGESGRCTPLMSPDSDIAESDSASIIAPIDAINPQELEHFEHLAEILADKDDEILKLKVQLSDKSENDTVDVATSANSKTTVKPPTERLCNKAQLVDKWTDYMQALGKTESEVKSQSAIKSTVSSLAKRRSSTDSARNSRSPSRASTGSTGTARPATSTDKRPVWKY